MFTHKFYFLWSSLLAIALWPGLGACAAYENVPVDPSAEYRAPSPEALDLAEFLAQPEPGRSYLAQVSYAPGEAKYFDLIDQTFSLSPAELALLEQNGFVVTDRLAFADFTTTYAYIYWKDLPVVVTTDSILQAVHKLHSQLLPRLEETSLTPRLITLLTQTRQQLRLQAQTNPDPTLAPLYTDLDIYLTVPLVLLTGEPDDLPGLAPYLELAQSAQTVAEIPLFGSRRLVDFTLFKPRGHYTQNEALERYFQAVSWLALVDFPLVSYPEGTPKLNLEQVAAAALLGQALNEAGQRPAWVELDGLFGFFIGRSDNVTLPDLDRFLVDAGIATPVELVHHPQPQQLLALLTGHDYGQQRIVAQILAAEPQTSLPPRPISFMLLGQRFTVDAYLMSSLVYDRLVVAGAKVERRLPNPLDVMYGLGNDRAATHLQDELAQYGYQGNLVALRHMVDQLEPTFWTDSLYNRWLGTLRELDGETTGSTYPQAMRTAAWADKMLHTQLASWAQLRHDNILYVKPSFTSGALCEYPAGYVEPYPEFYAAVHAYAQAGQRLLEKLDSAQLTPGERAIQQSALTQFTHLATVAGQLQTLAEKELRLEPFSPTEALFLKSIAVRQMVTKAGSCVPEPGWSGWYPQLFLTEEKNSALIADIHTDPGDGLFHPPSVLHAGTGPVAALLFIADTDEGPTMYVGPAFTYYEVVESGFLFNRLTNQDWSNRLSGSAGSYPAAPPWTGSFRLPVSAPPDYLEPPLEPVQP